MLFNPPVVWMTGALLEPQSYLEINSMCYQVAISAVVIFLKECCEDRSPVECRIVASDMLAIVVAKVSIRATAIRCISLVVYR